jgi:hypothetical protein
MIVGVQSPTTYKFWWNKPELKVIGERAQEVVLE